jgi:hypothetical protein
MTEKKCTCGDTESQHYENTEMCLVCGCKEFEEGDGWEKEFDRQFNPTEAIKATQDGGTVNIRSIDIADDIKDFIRTLITKTESDTLERVREWVKANGEVWSDYYKDGEYVPQIVVNADDLLTSLTENNNK